MSRTPPPDESPPPLKPFVGFTLEEIRGSLPLPTFEPENPFKGEFNWNNTLEHSLESLYAHEWPTLLQMIPYLFAALMTLAAAVKYQKREPKEEIDKEYMIGQLNQVVKQTLAHKAEDEIEPHERLFQKKVDVLTNQMRRTPSISYARTEREMQNFLQDVEKDFTHQEMYSSLQLDLLEMREDLSKLLEKGTKQEINAFLKNIRIYLISNYKDLAPTIKHEFKLLEKDLKNVPKEGWKKPVYSVFIRLSHPILKKADRLTTLPPTEEKAKEIDQIFTEMRKDLSLEQKRHFLNKLKYHLLPLLRTDVARSVVEDHLQPKKFSSEELSFQSEELKKAFQYMKDSIEIQQKQAHLKVLRGDSNHERFSRQLEADVEEMNVLTEELKEKDFYQADIQRKIFLQLALFKTEVQELIQNLDERTFASGEVLNKFKAVQERFLSILKPSVSDLVFSSVHDLFSEHFDINNFFQSKSAFLSQVFLTQALENFSKDFKELIQETETIEVAEEIGETLESIMDEVEAEELS